MPQWETSKERKGLGGPHPCPSRGDSAEETWTKHFPPAPRWLALAQTVKATVSLVFHIVALQSLQLNSYSKPSRKALLYSTPSSGTAVLAALGSCGVSRWTGMSSAHRDSHVSGQACHKLCCRYLTEDRIWLNSTLLRVNLNLEFANALQDFLGWKCSGCKQDVAIG